MAKPSPLSISFTWDQASGMFFARLSNGACFPVRRTEVSGKLENALTLYRRACVELVPRRNAFDLPKDRRPAVYDESKVQVCGVTPKASLSDLEIDL